MRLCDKPPTKYEDISPSVRNHLQKVGISDAADWKKVEQEQCGLCAPNADHWWSRCVKIWASTPKGFALLGQANAAKQLAQLHDSSAVHLIHDFAPLLQHTMQAARLPGEVVHLDAARDAVFQLMEACDVDDYYESSRLFATVNDVHAHAIVNLAPSPA